MPELVTKSDQAYEALALDLATNPSRLTQIKTKLQNNRLTTPLFDTEQHVKYLEKGYTQAYQRYFEGKEPQALCVE